MSYEGFPLVSQYFGKYLTQLTKALESDKAYQKKRFVFVFDNPDSLEARLQRIDGLGLTRRIVDEVGDIRNPNELDGRLLDAWAEIRVVDQLLKEGFSDIAKVTETADLKAKSGERYYAFQVKRIATPLSQHVERRNPPNRRSTSSLGSISDIHDRLDVPISYLFWEALLEKNTKFRRWNVDGGDARCIVFVTSDESLQDSMRRHIACQKIREVIHTLDNRHFEELAWFPDTGNGAWFKIGSQLEKTQCFVDWGDDAGGLNIGQHEFVRRKEIDLSTAFPIR